jgi:DNA topoisomerase-1
LDRIRALAIPPAWTDVWICAAPDGHLQATGRDQRGRKQYRYHADWHRVRAADKYAHLIGFAESLPRIRRHVAGDLMLRGMPWERVIATVVRLLETTLIRVGNREYAVANESYGLTTINSRHVEVHGSEIRLLFTGKGGREVEVAAHDVRAARIVRRCEELPGQQLFQYLDGSGGRHPIESSDVNEYLRRAAGRDVTAKDFRTWAGTLIVAEALAREGPADSERAGERRIIRAIDAAAAELGDTRAVCRACYVHPAVLESYRDGSLFDRMLAPPPSRPSGLRASERRMLAVLREATGRRSDDR